MEINALLQTVTAALPETEKEDLQKKLAQYIDHLIQNDFNRLVQLLYTLDIDERKLKSLLQQHPHSDAAPIISHLIIDRQLQKAQTRQQFTSRSMPDAEERW
jgi:hypothetical protein